MGGKEKNLWRYIVSVTPKPLLAELLRELRREQIILWGIFRDCPSFRDRIVAAHLPLVTRLARRAIRLKRIFEQLRLRLYSDEEWIEGEDTRAIDIGEQLIARLTTERIHEIARKVLVGRELRIFIGRYSSPPMTLEALSAELGVSEGMISKISNRALRKIRRHTPNENDT